MVNRWTASVTAACFIFLSLQWTTSSSVPKLIVHPSRTGCACPGEILTFICTVIGGTSTVWRGTTFNCSSAGNQIVLRHTGFSDGSQSTIPIQCNNGSIVGQPLNVTENCYISQLNVLVSARVHNKTVQCTHNGVAVINTSIINVISGPYPPPSNVTLVNIKSGLLVFTWNPADNDCSSVNYLITSNICGTICPSSTNKINITCSTSAMDLTNGITMCNISVWSEICGHVSNHSSLISVRLKVPDPPAVRVIPRYSYGNRSLISFRVLVQQMDSMTFNFTDSISSYISKYKISFYDSSTNMINEASNHSNCDKDVCQYRFNMSSILCSEDLKISVSAINQLGEGASTEAVTIDCVNNFVRVEVDSSSYTVTCVFLNQLDAIEKFCNVTYGTCHQGMTEMVTSDPTRSDTIDINLRIENPNQTLCYTITAGSGGFIAEVEGNIEPNNRMDDSSINTPIIVVIVVIILSTIIAIIVATVVIILLVRRRKHTKPPKHKTPPNATEHVDNIPLKPIRYFESIVRGYHEYKDSWTPDIGDILPTEPEPENEYDKYAVAVMNSDRVVGHMPRDPAKHCNTFMERGGQIECKITDVPRKQELTMTKDEERLEVPCIYKLSADDEQNLLDVTQMLQGIDRRLVKPVDNW